MDYESIKGLAKEEGLRITDLLALAPQNDPFYTGAPATLEAAQWFADLWRELGFMGKTGVHLRRVHYQLVSQESAIKPNGLPYENTENDWGYLSNASKYARGLGLVDPMAFVDRRNPAPHVFAGGYDGAQEPGFSVDPPEWTLPRIAAELAGEIDLSIPEPYLSGYDYYASNQPYHLELWIEKSTMDDVLLPLGRDLGLNVVTSLGFQSITSTIGLLQRIAEAGKPARIFYISDFDPAGDGMPTAVARQLEYWLKDYAAGADVALTPLALTREQVTEYRLPRIPVKDTDKRKSGFEDRYGEGAVELDALEALHPGALRGIVRAAVSPYRDARLQNRLWNARMEAEDKLDAAWQAATESPRAELDEITEEAREILAGFEDRLQELRDELDEKLAPLRKRLGGLRQVIIDAGENLDVDLPDRPDPKTEKQDESEWLYSSGRDYLAQMAMYKARKNGGALQA